MWILLKFKKWKPENCPCKLSKVYIDKVDFLKKRPETFFENWSYVLKALSIQSMYICNQHKHIKVDKKSSTININTYIYMRLADGGRGIFLV